MPSYETRVEDYERIIRKQVSTYEKHEFVGVSDDLATILSDVETKLGELHNPVILTFPCCIQEPFFSHKLTNIQIINEDEFIHLYVWAHGDTWKDEFTQAVTELCIRHGIRYGNPMTNTTHSN